MNDKKIPKRFKLKENHPTYQKISKLCAYAEDLGISLSFSGHALILEDSDQEICFQIEDIESGDTPNEFPFATEFRIVYNNPEYLEQERIERKKRLAALARQEREKAAREEKRKKEAADRAAKEKEEHERQLLVKLKQKYEE